MEYGKFCKKHASRSAFSLASKELNLQFFEKLGDDNARTLRMPCGAGVCAPNYSRFVLEDSLACKRDPVAAERAVARLEFDWI